MAHSIFLSRLNNSERKTLIERLWNIQKGKCFISGHANLPLWRNKEFSSTLFGGKQVYSFWQTIFETGRSPQGEEVLAAQ